MDNKALVEIELEKLQFAHELLRRECEELRTALEAKTRTVVFSPVERRPQDKEATHVTWVFPKGETPKFVAVSLFADKNTTSQQAMHVLASLSDLLEALLGPSVLVIGQRPGDEFTMLERKD